MAQPDSPDLGEKSAFEMLSVAPPDQWGNLLQAMGASIRPARGGEGPCTVTSLMGMLDECSEKVAESKPIDLAPQIGHGSRTLRGRRGAHQRQVTASNCSAEVPAEDVRDLDDLLRQIGEEQAPVQTLTKTKRKHKPASKKAQSQVEVQSGSTVDSIVTLGSDVEPPCPGRIKDASSNQARAVEAEQQLTPTSSDAPRKTVELAESAPAQDLAMDDSKLDRTDERLLSESNQDEDEFVAVNYGKGQRPRVAAMTAQSGGRTLGVSRRAEQDRANSQGDLEFSSRPSVGTWLASNLAQRANDEVANVVSQASADAPDIPLLSAAKDAETPLDAASGDPPTTTIKSSTLSWHARPSVGTWLTHDPPRQPSELWPATPEFTPPSTPRFDGCGSSSFPGPNLQQIVWVPVPVHLLGEVQNVLRRHGVD